MLIQLLVIYIFLNNDNDSYELVNFINGVLKINNQEMDISEFSKILQSLYNKLLHYISQNYILENSLGDFS